LSRKTYAALAVFALVAFLTISVFAVYPQATNPESKSTSTAVVSITTFSTLPIEQSWSLYSYNGGTGGIFLRGAIFLPYPVFAYDYLAGSDAQPSFDNPNYYTGFGFNAIFEGCAIGTACSQNVYNNMAVWLHSNESNYNYPEFGFTYRFGGACSGSPGSHAEMFGYVQWGNGIPSRTEEYCVPLGAGTDSNQSYFVTVNSLRENQTTSGPCSSIACYENTFRYYVDGQLAGIIKTPEPSQSLSDCSGLQCDSYFDYAASTYYMHAATHLYLSGMPFYCPYCSLTVSNFRSLA
jgi:hypothetical protein